LSIQNDVMRGLGVTRVLMALRHFHLRDMNERFDEVFAAPVVLPDSYSLAAHG